jgi:N-acetyl-anhydromuramoyl-L-alanine amidase
LSASDLPCHAMTTEAQPHGWRDGWLLQARAVPSPNFGPRPDGCAIDLVVLHSISLPPGQYGGPEIEQLFCNRLDWDAHPYFQAIRGLEVSSHFLIRRDGELLQFVSCDDRAWHAGRSHWRGRDNCNDDSIGIELEGLEGETFEPAQYQALTRLCQALAQRYPIAHLAGHEHVAPGRKNDPGPGFDWPQLMRRLRWPTEQFPATISAQAVISTQPSSRSATCRRDPGRIGGCRLQLFHLPLQDARQHQVPAGRHMAHSSGASTLSGVARMLASTTSKVPCARSGKPACSSTRLLAALMRVDSTAAGSMSTATMDVARQLGRTDGQDARAAAVVEHARTGQVARAIQRRHMRVVGWVPVPKAKPGSSRMLLHRARGQLVPAGHDPEAGRDVDRGELRLGQPHPVLVGQGAQPTRLSQPSKKAAGQQRRRRFARLTGWETRPPRANAASRPWGPACRARRTGPARQGSGHRRLRPRRSARRAPPARRSGLPHALPGPAAPIRTCGHRQKGAPQRSRCASHDSR